MEEGIVTDPVLDKDSLSLSTQKVGFWDQWVLLAIAFAKSRI